MALQKSITYKGYPFVYWKIVRVEIDALKPKTKIIVGAYKDRSIRMEAPESYVGLEEFEFPALLLSVSELYDALKTTEMLEGATDVLE